MSLDELRVRGGASAEELAVVLAALCGGAAAARRVPPSAYELWRRGRLAVVRPTSG